METLFVLLFLVSLGCLVASLIKPSWFKQESRKRSALIFGGASLVFFILIAIVAPKTTPTTTVATTAAPEVPSPATSTPVVAAPVVPVATSTPANTDADQIQQIKQLVYNVVHGTNSNGESNVREIDVTKASDDTDDASATGWDVKVEINIDGSRTLMNYSMAQIYDSIYANRKDIAKVDVVAFEPLIDQYGNQKDGEVYLTYLTGDQAYKVNWSQDQSTLLYQVLPNLWTVDYDATRVNPSLLSD